jgi:radical SAM protein with 4Fe4S-binding SPASM domain
MVTATAADRPRLAVVFVAMRSNVGELPALVRLVADLGVRHLRVQNLSHSFSDTDPAGGYAGIRAFVADEALWGDRAEAAASTFALARDAAAARGLDLRLPALDERPARRAPGTPGCDWPWRSAYVRHDGKVQPCCMLMGDDRAILGDLREESFDTIWRGEKYAAFRAALESDEPPPPCRGCSEYRGVF